MHFGARQQQPEECPWPSVALQSFYAVFPLLPGPALWDPVVGALPRGRARCAMPAGVRRGAAPQGPPRGAAGDGDARSRAGLRWGPPATAHALPRRAQPASSLDMQRPAGPRAPTCAARIKRQVTGSCSAPLSKGTGARSHGSWRCQVCGWIREHPRDAGLRRARCASARFFVFLIFSLVCRIF